MGDPGRELIFSPIAAFVECEEGSGGLGQYCTHIHQYTRTGLSLRQIDVLLTLIVLWAAFLLQLSFVTAP